MATLLPLDLSGGRAVDNDTEYVTLEPLPLDDGEFVAVNLEAVFNRLQAQVVATPEGLDVRGLVELSLPTPNGDVPKAERCAQASSSPSTWEGLRVTAG